MLKRLQAYPIETIFSVVFISIAAILNLQFLEGANINRTIAGHDEYLTVREVYSILNPLSLKHFILAVIGGDILYYGRVVFYTDALFAYIPYKIWGIEGMVYAIRMTHSLWLLVGLLLLNATFLKNKLHKFLFLFGSFGLYYTLYFIQMPKPEPLQLVFLALFVRGFIKKEYQFGLHYIWLGLAFATKVNALVLVPFLFLLPVIHYWHTGIKVLAKQTVKGLAWFFTGFFVGLPCLLLTPIQPVYLQTYLKKTIFGADRAYDDPNLTALDWIEGGIGSAYLGFSILGYILIGFVLVMAIYQLYCYVKRKTLEKQAVILLIGVVLTLSILFLSKRLWPHYLWSGYVFLWLGLVHFSESPILKQLKTVAFSLSLMFFATSAFAFYTKALPHYMGAANILNNEISSSKALYRYIENNFEGQTIGLDGTVWYPYQYFVKAKPYHPFSSEPPVTCNTCITWHQDNLLEIWENEVVIFNINHPPAYLSKKKNRQTPVNWQEIVEKFNYQTQNHFRLDTVIGSNWVYTRK